MLLEQFIRAKYEREEFVEPGRQTGYTASTKVGHLFKRHRDAAKFEIRRFELSEANNTLAYYVKEVRAALSLSAVLWWEWAAMLEFSLWVLVPERKIFGGEGTKC